MNNENLIDYPCSQLYRDQLDPDVREIVEQEDRATAMSDLQEDMIDLQRQINRLAAHWLESRGYYSGQFYPEERAPEMTTRPPAKPPPAAAKPFMQPKAKGGMKLPEIRGKEGGKQS